MHCAADNNYINCLLHFQTSPTMSSTSTPPATRTTPPAALRKPARKKPAAGTAGKPAAKSAAKPATQATPASKTVKAKKPKMVRDSFTIPKDEYGLIDTLKQRCIKLERPAKKSELLRAGIKALAAMGDKPLLAALQAVPSIKTGRPKKS